MNYSESPIVNNCNDDINASVILQKGDELNFIVIAQSEYVFFYDEWVGGTSHKEKIDYIFKEIAIKRDTIISRINYVDSRLWKKENVESSRKYKYYTNVNYYLTVTPKDFEE